MLMLNFHSNYCAKQARGQNFGVGDSLPCEGKSEGSGARKFPRGFRSGAPGWGLGLPLQPLKKSHILHACLRSSFIISSGSQKLLENNCTHCTQIAYGA